MFGSITWTLYWISVSGVLSVYYLGILFLYHRKTVLKWLQQVCLGGGGYGPIAAGRHARRALQRAKDLEGDAPRDEHPAIAVLKNEIKAVFETAEQSHYTNEMVLAALQGILRKSEGVKGTPYQYLITDFILFLAEQNNAFHLHDDEIGSVWL